jgi:spore coat protein U-like protein
MEKLNIKKGGKMKKLIVLLLTVTLIAIGGVALAATDTSNFNVTANASGNCRITTAAGNVDFGLYDPTDPLPDDDGLGSAGFRCTRGTTYWTYITGVRTMIGGAENLTFELYSDVARSTVFPNARQGAGSASPNNAEQTVNYYGRIPALQDVTAGNAFSTTLTFTVEY